VRRRANGLSSWGQTHHSNGNLFSGLYCFSLNLMLLMLSRPVVNFEVKCYLCFRVKELREIFSFGTYSPPTQRGCVRWKTTTLDS
jgi:hypothetical protein